MEREPNIIPMAGEYVGTAVLTALTLSYSAPTPGLGSRYIDSGVAHERRMLSASVVYGGLASDEFSVGQSLLNAVSASLEVSGYADLRGIAALIPLARAARQGVMTARVLRGLGADEVAPFSRAVRLWSEGGALSEALRIASEATETSTLREVLRFAAARDPVAREYTRNYEVTRQLAQPALLSGLSRADSTRAALVQTYLEVLSEVVDLDVKERAGQREAEEVSRMARGALKSGGAYSRRGLQAIANLDGILREDPRLSPTATEPILCAAAFLTSLAHGPQALNHRLYPATGR